MRNDEIRKLLKRYYDGETTVAEEEQLHSFFSRGDVADEWKADSILFKSCAEIDNSILIPTGWEKRLDEKLKNKRSSMRDRTILFWWVSGIVASLLLIVSFGIYELYQTDISTPKDTCATPEEAYREACKALLLFSTDLNNGLVHVQEGLSVLEY